MDVRVDMEEERGAIVRPSGLKGEVLLLSNVERSPKGPRVCGGIHWIICHQR